MKKKFQAAENYLTAQAKDLQEKLEFIKTQGAFFEKAMYPLERQREECRYIIDKFQRSAMQLPFPALPEENAVEVREWPGLSLLKNMEQRMSQKEMEAICQSIHKDSCHDDPFEFSENVVIDFENGNFIWHDRTVPLNDAVIEIEFEKFFTNPLESHKDCIDLRLGNRLKGTVYMRISEHWIEAILKATGDDGKDYFFGLNYFSMLFLLFKEESDDEDEAIDCKNIDVEFIEVPVAEDNTVVDPNDGNLGVFTLFSMPNHMLYATTY